MGRAPGAGFTSGDAWIAINPDHAVVNAADQVGAPASVLEHYRALIALRHDDPVVTEGDFELLVPDHPALWAFLRRGPGGELLVAANWSAEPTAARLPLRATGRPPSSYWRTWPARRRGCSPRFV